MPMFVSTNGILITVFAFLHWSLARTKLSLAEPSLVTYPATTEAFLNAAMTTAESNSNSSGDGGGSGVAIATADEEGYSSSSSRDSRYLQSTNDAYRWHGITQPQRNDYAYSYSDYASTSPGQTSTLTYPFITTPKPIVRHLKFRPRVTKLHVKAVRRGPNGVNNIFSDASDSFEDSDADFVPLVTLYGSQMNKWSTMPTHHVSPYTYGGGGTHSGYAVTSTGAATSFGHSGLTFTAASSSGLEDLHESASHHHVPIFTKVHHTPKFDMKKIGILALVKIGLAKLKAFGILKLIFILLLKFKLFLLAMFVKFVLFMKFLKVLKSFLIPLILLAVLVPVLLALLALPILLAPLLYSLLTMLPLFPAINISPTSRLHFLKGQAGDTKDTLSGVMDQLFNSTQCIERIACELATKKEAKLFFPVVNWYLDKISFILQNQKVLKYVNVYTKTVKEYKGKYSEEDGEEWCAAKYQCEKDELSQESEDSSRTKKLSKVFDPPRNYTR